MKVRSGFVSNSSSSSFIIAISPEASQSCPHCGRGTNIMELLRNENRRHWSNDTRVRTEDLDEIITYLREWYDSPGVNPEQKVQQVLELSRKGWQIVHTDISYHDDECRDYVWAEDATGKIKVICTGD